ncbi:MAG: hypothetical protein JWR80_5511 [Bradyrhizobium sp.]|nr:hypothetical protein [Bradyrhizobium sp.]
MAGVAYEAERRPGYCPHVTNPQPPTMLFGCKPSEAVAIAAERAERAVDSRGHELRIDGLVFLGGVASFPVLWTEIRTNEFEQQRLRAWLGYLLEFLQQQYGVSLHYVLLHTDEPYPHLHWGAVPGLEADRQMLIATLHPGHAAFDRVRAKDGTNSVGRAAYKQAMREWLDTIHAAVYAPVGISRIGPRRQRLSRSERNARKQADMALARTLTAEREIKETWHQEIRAESSGKFLDEIAHWKQLFLDQNAKLAAANKKIIDLGARLAELESQIEPPSGRMP